MQRNLADIRQDDLLASEVLRRIRITSPQTCAARSSIAAFETIAQVLLPGGDLIMTLMRTLQGARTVFFSWASSS